MDAPSLKEMGGTELPMWESENLQRQQYALSRNHESEMDNDFVFSKKPHLRLLHEGEGVPWKPPAGLTHGEGPAVCQDLSHRRCQEPP